MNEILRIAGMNAKAWTDKESMANAVYFSKKSKWYWITYDNAIENIFLIYKTEGVVKFARTKEGLCRCKLPTGYQEIVTESKRSSTCECSDNSDRKQYKLLL